MKKIVHQFLGLLGIREESERVVGLVVVDPGRLGPFDEVIPGAVDMKTLKEMVAAARKG